MILYDADPEKYDLVLAKFEGNRLTDKSDVVFQSFNKAKRYAKKQLTSEVEKLLEQIKALDEMTEETCPTIKNPFQW